MTPDGKFEASDFQWDIESVCKGITSEQMADRANELIQSRPVVYGLKLPRLSWSPTRCHLDTHRAHLLAVEKIEGESVENLKRDNEEADEWGQK